MPTLKFFFDSAVISLVSITRTYSLTYIVSGCSTWIALSPEQISSWSDEKCARKWSHQVLLCRDLVTSRQGQIQWMQYKMVEINGAYNKHGRYQTWDWEKVKKEENDAGVWGLQ